MQASRCASITAKSPGCSTRAHPAASAAAAAATVASRVVVMVMVLSVLMVVLHSEGFLLTGWMPENAGRESNPPTCPTGAALILRG